MGESDCAHPAATNAGDGTAPTLSQLTRLAPVFVIFRLTANFTLQSLHSQDVFCTLTCSQGAAPGSELLWKMMEWNKLLVSVALAPESICLSRANHCSGVHVMTSSEQAEITHTADHFITSEWLFIYLSAAVTCRDKACHSWANSPYSLRRWSGMWGS